MKRKNKAQDKTLFTELLGTSPEIKALDFLLIHKNYDYSLTEIARNSNIGYTSIHLFWKKWVKQGIVKKTRRIGRAQMYELNRENALVKQLAELHDLVLKDFVDEEIAKSKVKIKKQAMTNKARIKART
ncbi:hypothetical protein AYK26_01610 [Euryarchaeota archaeon SM23-78]|nr:MAG: hypothetical protein AYK26_01610 [Euryarchaeota archaeon SM23-78]